MSGSVAVRVVPDPTTEPNETFTLTISSPSPGTIVDPTGLGTIVDDDAARLAFAGDVSVVEGEDGDRDAVVTVVLDRLASTPLTLNWATVAGTAHGIEDFEPAQRHRHHP